MNYRGKSNFVSFLEHISPKVSVRFPSKSRHDSSSSSSAEEEVRKLHAGLRDIWSACEEWSTYSRGVPLTLSHGFARLDITQFYVPTLSAIQIFTNNGSSSGSSGTDSRLYMEFNETMCFDDRPPLTDKIDDLAKEQRGLKTLSSSDLSENSWFSVAWTPIYQIPAVHNEEALSVSFLTYHSFTPTHTEISRKGKKKLVLPAFGVVTSKLSGNMWTMPETSDEQNIETLEVAATSWLGNLMFKHNDFGMFMAGKSEDLPLPSEQ